MWPQIRNLPSLCVLMCPRSTSALLDGLSPDVVWQTGADTIVGHTEVGALMTAAFERFRPIA